MKKISNEYIRGLVEGEGTFTFYTIQKWVENEKGETKRIKRPAFAIRMHERDEDLLEKVRDALGVNVRVYWYKSRKENQAPQATFVVRDTEELRDKIIPLFYRKLHGNKGKQLIDWLEKMSGEDVWKEGKYLHSLYKKGYFDNLIEKK